MSNAAVNIEEQPNVVQTEGTTDTPSTTGRRPFDSRATAMGLTYMNYGLYSYSDQHGEVVYKKLKTLDDIEIPFLGVFTRPQQQEGRPESDLAYAGIVSDDYRFVGNEVVNESIRSSIAEIGHPIFREDTLLLNAGCQMHNTIVIRHESNVSEVGDVYPQIVITNSYNGTRAVNASFGISVFNGGERMISFGFKKFGAIRQVHIQSSRTTVSSAIGQYVQSFTDNITDLIRENFNANITEDQMIKALDTVEKFGKRRRTSISMSLSELDDGDSPMTRWQLFHAITRFSAMERNLNAKLMLEDIAEKILIIPVEMERVLRQLNGRRPT